MLFILYCLLYSYIGHHIIHDIDWHLHHDNNVTDIATALAVARCYQQKDIATFYIYDLYVIMKKLSWPWWSPWSWKSDHFTFNIFLHFHRNQSVRVRVHCSCSFFRDQKIRCSWSRHTTCLLTNMTGTGHRYTILLDDILIKLKVQMFLQYLDLRSYYVARKNKSVNQVQKTTELWMSCTHGIGLNIATSIPHNCLCVYEDKVHCVR